MAIVKDALVTICVFSDVSICNCQQCHCKVGKAIHLVKHESTASSGCARSFAFTTRLLSLSSRVPSHLY